MLHDDLHDLQDQIRRVPRIVEGTVVEVNDDGTCDVNAPDVTGTRQTLPGCPFGAHDRPPAVGATCWAVVDVAGQGVLLQWHDDPTQT
jgi:hypothetical protein